MTELKYTRLIAAAGAFAMTTGAAVAQNFVTDVTIQGSLCVGVDCSTGESFGFDTIRLKENNLRIKFQDTSASASFPSNDWSIEANDSSNGGANYLRFLDVDAGRAPFTVEAGAQANTLYVEDDGDVGIKTSTPVVDLHIVEGNTPTVRLEQDGSDGFQSQIWDLAGNETNFFLRDVTNASQLPFRSFPGTGGDQLVLRNSRVGIGTDNPSQAVHVRRTNGTATLLVEETQAGFTQQIQIINNGAPRMQFDNSATTNNIWQIGLADGQAAGDDDFLIRFEDTAGGGGNVFRMTSAGALTILGALTENSDKNNKMAIEPLDTDEILAKVTELPLSSWTYKHDAEAGIRHIGPMAQDFYALFGTGASEKGISTIDTAGVALAAIQALTAEVEALRAEIETLKQ